MGTDSKAPDKVKMRARLDHMETDSYCGYGYDSMVEHQKNNTEDDTLVAVVVVAVEDLNSALKGLEKQKDGNARVVVDRSSLLKGLAR